MPGQLGEGSLLACEDIACADKQMSTKPMTLHLPVKAAFFRLSRNVSAHHRPQGQERKKSQDNYQTVHNANANIASKPLNNCVCVPRTCRQHLQACQAGRPRPARPSLQQLQLRKPRREQRRRNRPVYHMGRSRAWPPWQPALARMWEPHFCCLELQCLHME